MPPLAGSCRLITATAANDQLHQQQHHHHHQSAVPGLEEAAETGQQYVGLVMPQEGLLPSAAAATDSHKGSNEMASVEFRPADSAKGAAAGALPAVMRQAPQQTESRQHAVTTRWRLQQQQQQQQQQQDGHAGMRGGSDVVLANPWSVQQQPARHLQQPGV